MATSPLELNLEAITNSISILERENKDENKEKIEALKQERNKLLKELKVLE